MRFLRLLPLVIVGAVGLPAPAGAGQQQDLGAFLEAVEAALMAPEPAAYAALVTASRDREDDEFAQGVWVPGTSRVTLRERDRLPLEGALPDEGYRLMLEILTERGRAARLATWRVEVRLTAATAANDIRHWRIVGQERLTSLDGLHRLALDPAQQYAVRNFVVSSTDLRLELLSGSVFVAETEAGVTALLLRGRGQIRFAPAPRAERTQMRIFAGAEALVTSFDQAFIRLNPSEYENRVTAGSMEARSVNPRDLRRAQEYFDENLRKTYTLNLGDLTDETWVLTPSGEDLVAEVHTRRFDTLTYAKSANEPEDISLFDRKNRRNIASYASPERLESRGRFYDEDDQVEYDVLDYKIDARFDPEREWLEGLATVFLAVRAPATTTLTLRIDEGLTVRSVSSPQFGRLMYLRVVGQNNLIVNLPAFVTRGTELELTVVYGGRLPAQSLEREAIAVEQEPQFVEIAIPAEPHWVYSNRVHWYPRSQVNDYATATLRLTVPEAFDCVATGSQAAGSPIRVEGDAASRGPRKIHVFIANQPVRYLSVVISRFVEVASGDVAGASPSSPGAPASAEAIGPVVRLSVVSNPRQQSRGRSLNGTAADILRFYTSIIGEAPYPIFTLAVTESQLPGGHSPAYFAVLNQPLPTSPYRWRDDPVSFDTFPSFFLAHEIAHQWWGQGVGWQNYHEQWLSEGISQYFAALYAQHAHGDDTFDSLIRQMRRWALRYSDQGPVYLGYRLGHVKGQTRVFRALVYNKAALVLHMLRRLIGDDPFFAGLRRFYREHKYDKAGSDDLRLAMEAESGRSLDRFFDGWIYGAGLPDLRLDSTVQDDRDGGGLSVTLRFTQTGEIFDLPVTVTLVFQSGARRHLVVPVTDRVVEMTVPLEQPLRIIELNTDNAALAEIDA